MYPIKFDNIYFEKIWGGRELESFRDNLPTGDIGESWDIACHPNGMSRIKNGEFKGKNLKELINIYNEQLLGKKFKDRDFPLLVKLINSKDKLSVQVHPNDEYEQKNENSLGKTEAWYVVDAKEGAELIVGVKECTKEEFKKAIMNGETEKFLNRIKVKKGDCFLINSGLVHAICEGVIIAEIQQNSDITYRIYDYGRPRKIHIDKSLDVIDFNLQAVNCNKSDVFNFDGYSKYILCNSEYFTIEKIQVKYNFEEESNIDKFYIYTCVEGNGIIEYGVNTVTEIQKGDSILIPSTLGRYIVKGNMILLKTYI